MSTHHLTRDQRIHRVAHTIAGTLDVIMDEWPDLGGDHQVRQIAGRTAAALNQLSTGDLEAADLNRQAVARMAAELPNGDTTQGAV